MKLAPKLIIAALILGLAAGAWTLRRPGPLASAQILPTALPPSPLTDPGHALLDRAISKYGDATRRNPKDGKAWINLGNALMQKARETADLSYYGHAEAVYQKVLALDPQSVPAMIGMAWVNSDRHEFEKSKAWANRALALDPKNNDAFGLLGDADQEMGDYDAAYMHYQAMLNIRPDLASYSRGGHLLWLTGNYRKGVWLMVKAIDAGGPYAESTGWCRAQLGLMLYSENHQVAAVQTLRDALKTTPNNYRVLMALGRVEAGQRHYAAAIDCYQKAVAVVPQLEALAALGDLYGLTGRQTEAQREYALMEQIDHLQKANGVRGGWQMALYRANEGRHLPESLRDAREEYRTRKNVYAADALAWCLYKNGLYQKAAQMSQVALSKHTPEAGFLFHAGMISAGLKDRSAAERSLRQAIRLNPNFSPIDAPVAVATLRQLGSGPQTARN